MAGFTNPLRYLFDIVALEKQNQLLIRHRIPYADHRDALPHELAHLKENNEPMEFSHTLTDLVGGQLDTGFRLVGWYEDGWEDEDALSRLIDPLIATCAEKPAG